MVGAVGGDGYMATQAVHMGADDGSQMGAADLFLALDQQLDADRTTARRQQRASGKDVGDELPLVRILNDVYSTVT